MAARVHGAAKLPALTWRIGSILACDESALAVDHARRTGAPMRLFDVDIAAPLVAPALRRVSPNTPISSIYREIKTVLYQNARAVGCEVLVNGHFGDHFFADAAEWAAGTLQAGAYREFCGEYRYRARQSLRLDQDAALRRWLRRMLHLPVARARDMPELQPLAKAALAPIGAPFGDGPRARQHEIALGTYAQFEASAEAEFAEGFGIHAATPYRQRELMHFMLSLPMHFSERRGVHKWLVRSAMDGILPEYLRLRPKSTSLQPFFDAAIAGPARARFEALVFTPEADWPRFYRPELIRAYWQSSQRTDRQSAVLWLCAGYELWRLALNARKS
jgi:asparagine synthetase B (glutamine-hydrolysing)